MIEGANVKAISAVNRLKLAASKNDNLVKISKRFSIGDLKANSPNKLLSEQEIAQKRKEEKAKLKELKKYLEKEKQAAIREPKDMAWEDELSMSWEKRERHRLYLISEYNIRHKAKINSQKLKSNRVVYLREEGLDYSMGVIKGFSRWRSHCGYIRSYLGHNARVYASDTTCDDKFIISASADRTLKLWNTETGECEKTFERNEGVSGHRNEVRCVVVFKDLLSNENKFLSCSSDKTLKLWNIETGLVVHTLRGHTDIIYKVAVSSDGQLAASCGADCSIRLWDLYNGREIYCYKGHIDDTTGVAISPDGKYIVSSGGYNDRTVRLWDIQFGLNESARNIKKIQLVALKKSNAVTDALTQVIAKPTEFEGFKISKTKRRLNAKDKKKSKQEIREIKAKERKREKKRNRKTRNEEMSARDIEKLLLDQEIKYGKDLFKDIEATHHLNQSNVNVNHTGTIAGGGNNLLSSFMDPMDFSTPFTERERSILVRGAYERWEGNITLKSKSIGIYWNSNLQCFIKTVDTGGESPTNSVSEMENKNANEMKDATPINTTSLLEKLDPNDPSIIIAAPSKDTILQRIEANKSRTDNYDNGSSSSGGAKTLCRYILRGGKCDSVATKNGFCDIIAHQRQYFEEVAMDVAEDRIIKHLEENWVIMDTAEYLELMHMARKVVVTLPKQWKIYPEDERFKTESGKKPTKDEFLNVAIKEAKDIIKPKKIKESRLSELIQFRQIRKSLMVSTGDNDDGVTDINHSGGGLLCVLENQIENDGGSCCHTDWVNDVKVSPDGLMVASVASDKLVKLWDIKTGWLIRTMTPSAKDGHSDIITTVNFSPNSARLVTSSFDKTMIIWNYITGMQETVVRGHLDVIYDAKWTRGGDRLFSASFDRSLRLWQVTPLLADPPNQVTFSHVFTNIHTHQSRVDLHWIQPNANGSEITRYWIQKKTKGVIGWIDEMNTPPSSRDRFLDCRLNPIKPGESYKFRIASQNVVGIGSYGEATDWISTPPAKPTVIFRPITDRVFSDAMDVRWTMPDPMGAPITKYIIEYRGGIIRKYSPDYSVEIKFKDAEATGKLVDAKEEAEKQAERKKIKEDRLYRIKMKALNRENQKKEYFRLKKMSQDQALEYKKGLKQLRKRRKYHRNHPTMIATVGNLEPGTQYHFRVCAINRIGNSVWSDSSISTQCLAAPPATPNTPVITCVTKNSIALEYEPPFERGSPITRMKLIYRECNADISSTTATSTKLSTSDSNETGNNKEIIIDKNDRIYTLTGLEAGMLLSFQLCAENALGWSEPSDNTEVIQTAITAPEPPDRPIARGSEPTSLYLKWAAPYDNGSQITSYNIYTRDNEIGDFQLFSTYEVTSENLDDNAKKDKFGMQIIKLFADTLYEFKVAGVNGRGEGALSEASVGYATNKAKPPVSPPQLTASDVTDRSVILHYEEPSGRGAGVIGYKISQTNLLDSSTNKESETQVYDTKHKSIQINRLKPKGKYSFKVCAYNVVGDGDWSSSLMVQLPSKAQYISIKGKLDENERNKKSRNAHGKKQLDSLLQDLYI